jgi:penicillin-binding protein 2
VFVAFAPYDNPQIAITVILEHANSTPAVTSVARAMFDAYFFGGEQSVDTTPPFTVIE